jgi:hypothetical protein
MTMAKRRAAGERAIGLDRMQILLVSTLPLQTALWAKLVKEIGKR